MRKFNGENSFDSFLNWSNSEFKIGKYNELIYLWSCDKSITSAPADKTQTSQSNYSLHLLQAKFYFI